MNIPHTHSHTHYTLHTIHAHNCLSSTYTHTLTQTDTHGSVSVSHTLTPKHPDINTESVSVHKHPHPHTQTYTRVSRCTNTPTLHVPHLDCENRNNVNTRHLRSTRALWWCERFQIQTTCERRVLLFAVAAANIAWCLCTTTGIVPQTQTINVHMHHEKMLSTTMMFKAGCRVTPRPPDLTTAAINQVSCTHFHTPPPSNSTQTRQADDNNRIKRFARTHTAAQGHRICPSTFIRTQETSQAHYNRHYY